MSVDPVAPPGSPPAAGDLTDERLWAPARRSLIVGLVLTITLVAFEALAIATVMPDVKDDIGGLALYGWVFSGFFLASLLGIVVAGQLADRHGLALPYVAGLGIFAVGLVVGGAAQSMPMLIGGRLLQGFGAGAIPATAYAAIARGVPSELRPKVFAILSTAWVVPGLIGPAAAIAIEHALSWRAVFLVLLPVVVVAGAMTFPSLVRLGRAEAKEAEDAARVRAHDRRHLRKVALLVVGVAAVLGAGTGPPWPLAVLLVAAGLPTALHALVHLLPVGTLRLAPGVPATVAVRGILTFAFFSADAYVPLAIVDGRGAASWIAGAALTACSVSWAGGSWLQSRLVLRLGPRRLDQTGFLMLVIAVLGLLVVARGAPVGLVVMAWALGGAGMGMAYAPLSVTVLAAAAPGEEGAASSGIQLSDALGIALGTGLAGWLIAVGDSRGWAVDTSVTWVFVLALVVSIGGVMAAGRLPERIPDQAT